MGEIEATYVYHYEVVTLRSIPDLAQEMTELGAMGYRLVYLSERAKGGTPIYEAIMEKRFEKDAIK